jgi:SNF2 family DNA or RNA helicase
MIDFPNIEFHRQGYAMVADHRDKDPGSPICFPPNEESTILTGFCTCRQSQKNKGCPHFSELIKRVKEIKKNNGRHMGELFIESRWGRISAILSEGDAFPCAGIQAAQNPNNNAYVFSKQNNVTLARLLDNSAASLRFIERVGITPKKNDFMNRADLLHKMALLLVSPEEKVLNNAGMITVRQAAEQSFWGRLAYHAFREYGDEFTFRPAIDRNTGDFVLNCGAGKINVFELIVPRLKVRKLLKLLNAEFPNQPLLAIYPIPLKSIFLVTAKTKIDLEIRPAIQALQATGETQYFKQEDFAKFRYGDLVFLKELNVLAELEPPDSKRRFASPVSMNLTKSRLPFLLDEHREAIEKGTIVLDEPLRKLSVHREFDRIEIELDALKRSWYWLSINYGFGSETISLAEILKAKKEGTPYLQTKTGWVHVNSEAFSVLDGLAKRGEEALKGKVRLSAIDLLRLRSSYGKQIEVTGDEKRSAIVQRLFALTPAKPWQPLKGLKTQLRSYQEKGVDWLRFLFENQLGGLLCDDMGLGKTHQAMALISWLKEKERIKTPFLVVCPTTVISHWRDKIRDHAPGLTAIVYHGGNRKITEKLRHGEVLLTSYAILRNDILDLKEIPFSLVIFDEIQNLKNCQTQGFQAACLIQAQMRIGLTGTPIENSLGELKALFDLVLPGYMGTDEEYAARYLRTIDENQPATGLQKLRRIISPFTLRRLKKDVLTELPEKIDDMHTCALSEMQVKLYREALAAKGAALLTQLKSDSQPVPYVHIFALLNLLKRICDHPALALNRIDDFQSYESGKWDLFQELLFETLDSGQKAVVFTQYLGMIAMMERLLESLGIKYVSLTGSSQNRGEIVRRFNEDPDCRVFLGSLKAGGTGIDLVGGTTVLHYDRWWNAAREDQATDRVHRIGQKQTVHIFKLVTEGTLEEKISAIIEQKRQLMDSVVQADNPRLSKIFTRDELIELLKPINE